MSLRPKTAEVLASMQRVQLATHAVHRALESVPGLTAGERRQALSALLMFDFAQHLGTEPTETPGPKV